MSSAQTQLGRWGEGLVGEWLCRKEYRVICTDYRCRLGEIDLIARKDDMLTFVEVKLRRDDSFAEAREHVTPGKQRRVRAAANVFLAEHPEYAELHGRFDVAEVYAPEGTETQHPRIHYMEDAFE